jgi:hypothetical protein
MTGEQRGRSNRRNNVGGGRTAPAGVQRDSEFINLELDKETTVIYRQWREDAANVLDIWTEEVESGYRFSIKYDEYSASCACFMFPPDGDINSGYILTGRGGSPFRAISECLYKHRELFRGSWLNAASVGKPVDDPDF